MAIAIRTESPSAALAGAMGLGVASDVLDDLNRAEKVLEAARKEFEALGKRWPKGITTYTTDGGIKILETVLDIGNEMERLWRDITAPGEPSALAKYLRERNDYQFALKRLKLMREQHTYPYTIRTDLPTSFVRAKRAGEAKVEAPNLRDDMGRFLRKQLNELEKLVQAARASEAGFARSFDRFYGAGQKFTAGVADVASAAWDATKAVAGGVADAAAGVGGLLKYLPYAAAGVGVLWITKQLRDERAPAASAGLGGILQDVPGIPSAISSALGWTSSRAIKKMLGNKDYGVLVQLAGSGVAGYLVGYGYARAVGTPLDTGAMAGAIGGLYDAAIGDLVPPTVAIPVSGALGWFGAKPAADLLLGEG